MEARIAIPYDRIAELCQRYRIRKLALFGSVLRDDFRPDSDVDVLVEFEPDAVIGWKIVTIEEELSGLLGRGVDLKMAGDLSRHFRQKVVRSAQIIYEVIG